MSQVKVTYPALSRSELVDRLKKASISLKKRLPLTRLILFGSYAMNRYTAASDIDLLVVYDGRERGDAFKIVMDELRLPRLEPRIYTEEQYKAVLIDSAKFAEVLSKEGLPIVGEV
jgi:predicted nucleotidyltransferase